MGDKIRFKDYDDAAQYEPTDSEDNLSEEEKELLKKVRQGNKRKQSSKQEVLAFDESDENEDDDGDDNDEDAGDDDNDEEDDVRNLIADSDIEGATDDDDDDLPDTKAWGKKSQNYYGSDFVDQNYSSAYTDKELELAEMEEEEALATQQRLAENIKDEDFFELYENNSDAGEDTTINKEIPQVFNINKLKTKTNPTILSKREKLELFENDAPEFMGLVEDLQMGLNECGKLLFPIMEYARDHKLPKIPALQFAELMNTLLTTYCSNINFYLILKANRVSIPTHPISKRLLDLKEILESLTPRYEKIIKPQLEALLERIEDGDEFEILPMKKTAEKAKSSKKAKSAKKAKKAKAASKGVTEQSSEDEMAAENEDDQGEEAAEQGDEDDERRGITYQISKNKGLTPHRKKELRNPRVKHRSKFRKALIRRKGAVRTVRTETKRYGGEISGIKATVSKSVKFKS